MKFFTTDCDADEDKDADDVRQVLAFLKAYWQWPSNSDLQHKGKIHHSADDNDGGTLPQQ